MPLPEIIREKNWGKLCFSYSPRQITQRLYFRGVMKLAYELLYNTARDDDIHNYGLRLLENIRKKYPQEWGESWEYDAFLGEAYRFNCFYDESFYALKRALGNASSPTPSLLIRVAKCTSCPGPSPIPLPKAIQYLHRAIKEYLYSDATNILSSLHDRLDETQYAAFWKNISYTVRSGKIEPPFMSEPIDDADFIT